MRRAVALACAGWFVAGCGMAGRIDRGADDPTVVTIELGREEIVFDWTTDRCEPLDFPDAFARAIRRAGDIVLISGHAPRIYSSSGPNFDHLKRSCAPVLTSPDEPGPESFRNLWWIMSVYAHDEGTIHALVHNEFHDPVAPNCKRGDPRPSNPCWYNAITYVVSHDGGRSFQAPSWPENLVAPPPLKWDPSWGELRGGGRTAPPPYGYFEPSNIVRGPDGAFYTMFYAITRPGTHAEQGTCVMRTTDLATPSSWRLWDGQGFTIAAADPYAGAPAPACAFVSPAELAGMRGSLTYNTYLGRYMLVGATSMAVDAGPPICGFFYSVSNDLIRWSMRRLLKAGPLPWCRGMYRWPADLYPSVIDHADRTANFEEAGRRPHLYFTRFNTHFDRDLIRVRLTITRAPRSR